MGIAMIDGWEESSGYTTLCYDQVPTNPQEAYDQLVAKVGRFDLTFIDGYRVERDVAFLSGRVTYTVSKQGEYDQDFHPIFRFSRSQECHFSCSRDQSTPVYSAEIPEPFDDDWTPIEFGSLRCHGEMDNAPLPIDFGRVFELSARTTYIPYYRSSDWGAPD